MPTTYDTVAYPSKLFERTQPERLAVFAALHGLTPPPVDTARVLEIGCGEGHNIIGLAAAWPHAQFVGFDLAETAIARGRALAALAGLGNVTLEVRNALDAAQHIAPGSFDYIIAHGVYAWVPEPVRAAIMALIGHALSPHGVAYISYNALPGGYFRMAMRDMLLHEVSGIADPAARVEAARDFLKAHTGIDAKKNISVEHMRLLAEEMLDRDASVLFHDELGEVFDPQLLSNVVAAAGSAGLLYLCDGEHVRLYEGFLEPGEDESGNADRMVLRKAQSIDFLEACYFRLSLFVRDEARPCRTLDPDIISRFWISTVLAWDEEKQKFHADDSKFLDVDDAEMNAAFHKIAAARPGRLPVEGLIRDQQRRRMFVKLFAAGHVDFHTGPAPFAMEVGPKPASSPLIRAEIAAEKPILSRLDHKSLTIDQPHVRALLAAANGQRTIAEMAAELGDTFPADEIVPALNAAARKALMQA
jgi:SAM-dependent methyltransferase